jgi:hypothetical protein
LLDVPDVRLIKPISSIVFGNGGQSHLPSAVYSTLLAKRPDVQLDKLENDSPDDQIQVNMALLARTPT